MRVDHQVQILDVFIDFHLVVDDVVHEVEEGVVVVKGRDQAQEVGSGLVALLVLVLHSLGFFGKSLASKGYLALLLLGSVGGGNHAKAGLEAGSLDPVHEEEQALVESDLLVEHLVQPESKVNEQSGK